MRAATSDNVQPLAILACEKFGATIAMCSETSKKIEDLIIKVSGPTYVRFINAQIGYSAKDSATQLSRSLAGIYFLGLAAALVTSVGTFEGADALSVMLMDSSSDKTLLPTARQLKDLLAVMEHRVIRSGFTDIWVGYHTLVSNSLRGYEQTQGERPENYADIMQTPGTAGISKLVEAFRQLNRLGDVTDVTIRTTCCAPWVMAFTRWCLGIPPSTYLPWGEALLDEPTSRTAVFIDNNEKASCFEITVQRSIKNPTVLLNVQVPSKNPSGMVTLESYGQLKCQEIGGEGSLAYRAMSQALPYALKQVCELLRPVDNSKIGDQSSRNKTILEEHQTLQEEYTARSSSEHCTQPFPEDFMISRILTRVLNSKSQEYLQSLDNGQLISDLPLVRLHMQDLTKGCVCNHCQKIPMPPHKTDDNDSTCRTKEEFLHSISLYVADILALSIYENPETLLLVCHHPSKSKWTPPGENFRTAFRIAVHSIIKSGKPIACAVTKILAWALNLVGHKTPDDEKWVISCCKGQAVYPRVFETGDICQPGYLMLHWAPGLLFFDGEVYDKGVGPPDAFWLKNNIVPDPVSKQPYRPVTEPLNLLPKLTMTWKVIRSDDHIEIYPACGDHMGQAPKILLNLSRALILRECPHDRASPVGIPDRLSYYRGPFEPLDGLATDMQVGRSSKKEHLIAVIAVDGDAGLRAFAMSVSNTPSSQCFYVIRDNACLQCCLDLCRRAGYRNVLC